MLLIIHNLPSDIRYNDVKTLIKDKCGLTDVIIDNLISEGKSKKVTVGLADEEDAAILLRKINGLYLCNQQLYVEDVRQKKKTELPNRPDPVSNPFEQERHNQQRQPRPQISRETQSAGPSVSNFGIPFYMTTQNQNVENDEQFMIQYPKVVGSKGNQSWERNDIGFDKQYRGNNADQSMSIDRSSHRDRSPISSRKRNENNCDRSDGRKGHDRSVSQYGRYDSDRSHIDQLNLQLYQQRSNQDSGPNNENNKSFEKPSTRSESNWEQPECSTHSEQNEKYRFNDTRTFNVQDRRYNQEREQQRFSEHFEADDSHYTSQPSNFSKKRPYDSSNISKLGPPNKKFGNNQQFDLKVLQRASDNLFSNNYQNKPNPYVYKSSAYMQSKEPHRQPKKSLIQPKGPFVQPKGTPKQPKGPPIQPKRPPIQPKGPTIQSKGPPIQPKGTPIQPKGPPIQSIGPPTQPKGPFIQPKGPFIQPKGPPIQSKGLPIQAKGPSIQHKGPFIQSKGPPIQPKGPHIQSKSLPIQPKGSHVQSTRLQMPSSPCHLQKNKPQWQPTNQPVKYMKKQANITKNRPTPNDNKNPTPIMLAKQEAWRVQAGALIATRILNNIGISRNKRDPVLIKLKACVRARIDVITGDNILFSLQDIINNYNEKFQDDVAFYHAVVEKVENSERIQFEKQDKETEQIGDNKKTATTPQLPFTGKLLDKVSGPDELQKLPRYPQGDKKLLRDMKQAQKEEMLNNAVYKLDGPHEKALQEELDTIDNLIKRELGRPKNEIEMTLSKFMRDVFVPDLRKILSLHVTKRILDIRTNLSVRLICQYKPPKRDSLTAFLKNFGVLSLMACEKNRNVLIAICDSYESFDALCRQGSIFIDGLKVTFKALHITGRPLRNKPKKQGSKSSTTQNNNNENNNIVGTIQNEGGSDEEDINDGNEELNDSKENDGNEELIDSKQNYGNEEMNDSEKNDGNKELNNSQEYDGKKELNDSKENDGNKELNDSKENDGIKELNDSKENDGNKELNDSKENDDNTGSDDQEIQANQNSLPPNNSDNVIEDNVNSESNDVMINEDDKVDDKEAPDIAREADTGLKIIIDNDERSLINNESVTSGDGVVIVDNNKTSVSICDEIGEYENFDNENIADDDLEDF